MNANEVLMPGETLGLMGGGQLGRMFAQAAPARPAPRAKSPASRSKRSTTTWPASPRSQAG